jgi:uncharacterized membrane protein YkoI
VRDEGGWMTQEDARISDDAAVRAARKAVRGHVTLTRGGEVRVENEDDRVVVEFVRRNAPGERGPDYEARVTLDARTGEVLDILGGS